MNFYGLLGYPLGHSLSPVIHKIIYKKLDLDAAYKVFEVEEKSLACAVEGIKLLDIAGANVTVPYKQKVMSYLDHISESAQRLQAVNTIKNLDGQLCGFNTDYDGVARTFQRLEWPLKNQETYILGTGGASQAVAYYLQDQGAQVSLVSRQAKSGGHFSEISYGQLQDIHATLLVNATPVGMFPKIEESPVDQEVVSHFDYIFDVIYGKEDNRLIKMAKDLNKPCQDGLEMLIGQAIAAVEIWFDQAIDDEMMDEILEHFEEEWAK